MTTSGTPLTAFSALEPLTTNIAAYTGYTTIETGLTFYITDEATSWATWQAQVADTTAYVVTDADTTNSEKFSSFFLSLKITTGAAADDSVCFRSSRWGAVCLVDSGSDAIATYRISTTQWDTAVAAFSANEGEIVTSIKGNTDALKTTTEWLDKFSCTLTGASGSGEYTCNAWQPDWMGGVTQGYPRFGSSESSDGELSYAVIDVSSTSFTASTDVKTWTIEGSFSLVASAVVALSVALAF